MGPEQPSIASVFDFPYIDRPRLASYITQFSPDGALVTSKRTQQESSSQTLRGVVGSTQVALGEKARQQAEAESVERHFDSVWTTPLSALDLLDEHGFILRLLKEARIGSLLVVSGQVRLMDVRLLREMYEPLAQVMFAGQAGKGAKQNKQMIQSMMSLLQKLPHAIQMTVEVEADHLWSTLDPTHLLIKSEDLALKHGSNIAGTWTVLGIVDALPDSGPQPGIPATELEQSMWLLADAIRSMMGRPQNSYGITPLLIFRELDRLEAF